MAISGTPFSVSVPNFVQICAIATELWALNGIKNGCCRHLELTSGVDFGHTTCLRLQLFTFLPKFVTVSQPAAELLCFVEKIQNGGVRHLELVFGNSGPPTNCLLMDLKRHSKSGVNRTSTFQGIVILKFCKLGLKRLFRPNLRFGGFNP